MSIKRAPFTLPEESAIASVLKTTQDAILAQDALESEPAAAESKAPAKDAPWGVADEGELSSLLARSNPIALEILSPEMKARLSPSRPSASNMTPEQREEKAARSEAVRQEVAEFNSKLAARHDSHSEAAPKPFRPRP